MASRLGELKEKALREVKAIDVVGLCSKLVRARSENPPGDVSEAAGVAMDWLSEHGHDVRRLEPEPGRINILVDEGRGRRCLLLMGHIDVVPAGDMGRWSFDPFCGDVRDGRVLGRGSTDMKGGVACIMAVFHALSGLLEELNGRLKLALTCDEETGGRLGAGYMAERGLLDADGCFIAEPSTPYLAILGERGLCWLKLVARGRPAHGSVPELGVNAIRIAMDAVNKVLALHGREVEAPGEIRDVLMGMGSLIEAASDVLGLRPEVARAFVRACSRITVNVGTIRGGTKVNMVPESCEVELDVRVPPSLSTEQVIEEAEGLLSGLGEAISLEVLARVEPSFTNTSSYLFSALKSAAEEVLGLPIEGAIMPACTDAHYLRARGIPTIIYGPGSIGLAHSYDEYVLVEHLELASRVLCAASINFLAQGGAGSAS